MSREHAGVAITGIGAITPLGASPEEFTRALDDGRTAISPAPWSDPEAPASWAAMVADFDPLDWMDARLVDGTDRFAQYALAAAQQAVEDHGEPLEPGTGVVIGTTMAGVTSLTEAQRQLDLVGPEAVHRKLNIRAWPNMAAGQIAIRHALHGPLLTVSTACASSIDALGTAMGMIQTGRADVVIAGGTERGLCEVLHHSQASYGMTNPVTDPALATMPFDRRRSGLVEGEGAAVFVLESLERAIARGARIHGVLAGYGSLSDGSHPSSPDPSGIYEAQAMLGAQRMAGVSPWSGWSPTRPAPRRATASRSARSTRSSASGTTRSTSPRSRAASATPAPRQEAWDSCSRCTPSRPAASPTSRPRTRSRRAPASTS